MNETRRLLSGEKYWLKRALVRAEHRRGPVSAAAELVDIRVEAGMVRAVLPAGGAPCCARGVNLEGGAVEPLAAGARIEPGARADLLVVCHGGRITLRGGAPEGPCEWAVTCVCTPPLPEPPAAGDGPAKCLDSELN